MTPYIDLMKHLLWPVLAASLCANPAASQDTSEGSDLMERGMGLLFQGLREEMSPALENMRKLADDYGPAFFNFLEEMGPAFGKILDDVKDWAAYHPPEILPNGDIIIRKKVTPPSKPETEPDATPEEGAEPSPQGQTDI